MDSDYRAMNVLDVEYNRNVEWRWVTNSNFGQKCLVG